MNELISVVIPVYNVEKYLAECLDSIVDQTYKNLQIILVDDGSTDSSGKICDEYAEKDNRITVVHQENQGAGAAKNTGLDLIKGAYFSIIDADDFIDLKMYETMLSYMMDEKVDIVQCRFFEYYQNDKVIRDYVYHGKHKLTAERYLFELLYDWKYAVFWNMLFKTNLLYDIRFPVGRKIDDEFFTYKLVCNAKSILNIEEPFCYYRMRKSSVMNDSNNERLIKDRIDCFVERYDYVGARFNRLKNLYYYKLADYIEFYYGSVSNVTFIEATRKQFSLTKVPYIKRKIYSKFERTHQKPDNTCLVYFD